MAANGVEADAGADRDGVYGDVAEAASSRTRLSGSGSRSAFVRRITGRAPLSQASVRYRSSSAQVQVVGERGHDEDDVDVRRDDLLARDVGSRIVGGAA